MQTFRWSTAIWKGVKTATATAAAVWAALQSVDVSASIQAINEAIPQDDPVSWAWLLPVGFGLVRLALNVIKHFPAADTYVRGIVIFGLMCALSGCALFGQTPLVEETITLPDGTVKTTKQVDKEFAKYQQEMQSYLVREGFDVIKDRLEHKRDIAEAEQSGDPDKIQDALTRWAGYVETLGKMRDAITPTKTTATEATQ